MKTRNKPQSYDAGSDLWQWAEEKRSVAHLQSAKAEKQKAFSTSRHGTDKSVSRIVSRCRDFLKLVSGPTRSYSSTAVLPRL
ncbi:MAG: hypothetical protein ABI615_05415 [Chthoniobacterales bacterium]